uniref:Uncharacterized protein n=1 Tax=Anguilla anguilla TaxID=7936 RepID=A0A0E9PWW9_ANGAN
MLMDGKGILHATQFHCRFIFDYILKNH